MHALRCMQAGYRVLGLDVAPQEDPALQHTDYQFATADIRDVEQTKKIAARVSIQGGLKVLINNAGIADPFLPDGAENRIRHWLKVVQINLTGMSCICKVYTDRFMSKTYVCKTYRRFLAI